MLRPRPMLPRAAAPLFLLLAAACARTAPPSALPAGSPPAPMLGAFADDYGSRHAIARDAWTQEGYATYHVVRWNTEAQYLVARNDSANPQDGGTWTRIDWMPLQGMPPYAWAYCISTWNAATAQEAERAAPADRSNPRTGCGGHPFTRMRRAD